MENGDDSGDIAILPFYGLLFFWPGESSGQKNRRSDRKAKPATRLAGATA